MICVQCNISECVWWLQMPCHSTSLAHRWIITLECTWRRRGSPARRLWQTSRPPPMHHRCLKPRRAGPRTPRQTCSSDVALVSGQWSVVSSQLQCNILFLWCQVTVCCVSNVSIYLSTNIELCAQLRNAVWSSELSWTWKLQSCIYLVFILHLNAAGHVYRLSRDRNITGKSSYHWETRVTLAEASCSLLNNRKAVMCIWFGRVAWCVIDN